MSPSSVYIALTALFHLGLVIPYDAGVIDQGSITLASRLWIDSPSVPRAYLLVALAFFAYALGGCLRGDGPQQPQGHCDALREASVCRGLRMGGAALALVSIAICYAGAYRIGLFRTTYLDAYLLVTIRDPRLFQFGLQIAGLGTLICAAGCRENELRLLALSYLVMLMPLFLFGYRGPILVIMLTLLVAWDYANPRTARKLLVGLLALAFLAAPVISQARNAQASSQSLRFGVSVLDLPAEAGGTIGTVVMTVRQLDQMGEG
ncbi:MAG: O-antigen polysaccharide polymerase Wzy, partial [Anaerolineales bacterium]|nr:O-antigen polysaccharide polymerase Wzy [Anaerolineales bacterium]